MKARPTNPRCMSLKWRKDIFDNPFTKLKYILCGPFFSLVHFFKKTKPWLGSHPILGASARDIEKTSTIGSSQATLGGHKRKFSIIKVPKQNWVGMKKNPKDPKILSIKKKPIQWCSKPNGENKNKEKEPKPNTRGHNRPFWKDIPKTKGQETSTNDP